MRYTSASIDRAREADIVKTIENSVELKRAGSVYKGCCPFHNEKTPSFVVSPVKQIYKCFGCGKAGDGLSFVMQKNNIDFIEAVETVAKIHSIYLEKEEVNPEQQRKLDEKAEMYKFIDKVSRSFSNAFTQLKDDHWAKKMIAERGFNQDSIIDFQIGYNGSDNKLTKWAIENGTLGISKSLGLSKTKNSSSYDIFRDRIMFPIHNHKGTVVGFGGRQSNDEKLDSTYKYINSKESPIYDKSAVLYGLFQAKHLIAKQGTVILTEGYTDVISMHQHGCENTVSSSGTALSEAQARLLKKYAQEIVILRDGDEAGIKATLRDIDICLAEGLNVSLCILPEGEDPDSYCRKVENMQEWILTNKQDALHWKADRYDFKPDRYDATIEDIKETAKNQIKALQDCFVETDELDGEELKKAQKENKQLSDDISQIKKETEKEIRDVVKVDPYKKDKAAREMAETLFLIKNEVSRQEYIKQLSKKLNITAVTLKNTISDLEQKQQEAKKEDEQNGKPSLRGIKLPEGADKEEYLEGHGFVTVGNSYWFQRTSNQSFFEGTNFKLEPLFHIQGDKENKRLCEITNTRGKKKLVDFDSDMLANFGEFRKYLFRIGGFLFLTHNGVRTEHFDRFVYRFEEQFEPALELLTMGENAKGFYAFANGVQWKGKFRGVNKYGIMHLEGIDETDSEYNQKIDYYYSPAFSVMHQDKQEGDDIYENDRYFVFKEASISLDDWMKQMVKVFDEKGIIGVVFNFGSIFRDLFLSNYDSFPLLGGFGEKDSGKSGFGKILQNFFYYRLPALDLTQATHVGFSRRLSRNTNTVQFCDEYQDRNVKEEVFNGMMGAWNGIGREKGNGVGTNRTSYDKINSAIYYAGQFMPTRMENALGTRTISLFFQTRNFSPEEKSEFNKLLNWTNSGISSLVTEVRQHRDYFEKRLPLVHAETERELKQALKDEQYQERIFGNVAMLLTTFRILKDKIDFPFTDKKMKAICTDLIIDNSEQIADSNGLTEFWSILTFLYEHKVIDNERDFLIDTSVEVKITGEKRQESTYQNQEGNKILYLRLKSIYQHYNKEVSKREGVDIIGQTTLRHYFKSRPYFIGLVRAKRFGDAGPQSCYAFDYSQMEAKGLVTLQADLTGTSEGSESKKDNDLPF